jgi:hypothetical protein
MYTNNIYKRMLIGILVSINHAINNNSGVLEMLVYPNCMVSLHKVLEPLEPFEADITVSTSSTFLSLCMARFTSDQI